MSCGQDQKTLPERVANFLRQVHPSKTAVNVAADTGCSVYQVEKWLDASSAPSGPAIERLISAYGPEFLVAFMPDRFDWLDAALQVREAKAMESELDALQKRLNQLRANL